MNLILTLTIKIITRSIIIFIVFISSYLIAAHYTSRIAINLSKKSASTYFIYIKSNGVHTDIVLPVKSIYGDLSYLFPYQNTLSKDSNQNWLAFGWGDKGFYLNTPTWADLTAETAVRACFGLSSSAIHTTYYKEMEENETCKKILVSKKQLLRIKKYILYSLTFNDQYLPDFISTKAIYGDYDAFYEARGTYSLFQTCNTWANRGLVEIGICSAPWTAFQGGIFCHYP